MINKRKTALVILILLIVTILSTLTPLVNKIAFADSNKFDGINVLDDLKSATIKGKPFNILNYPFDSSGLIKKPEILNVVEYCYSFKVNMQGNYGLYLYFYNPQALNIKTDSKANKVQIATAYGLNKDGDVVPTKYEKFDLQFCNMSTESNYYRLFYKFKVIDRVGADGKTILQRLNSNERRYDISGVELLTSGNTNATEYTVGGSYNFTGYAKGYGANEEAESNLACNVRTLETVRIDLAGVTDGIDKRTYWRSNSSSVGAYHQNQINSVFFAIDKKVLEKYGYTLQKIKAEWWEYRTRPAIVIDDLRIYNELAKFNGVKIDENYEENRGFIIHNKNLHYNSTTDIFTCDWSWNIPLRRGPNNYLLKDKETLLPLLFYTKGIDVQDYKLTVNTLQEYITKYSKSYNKGKIEFNEKSFSADLFSDNVDSGRTKGYNLRTFDIGDPNDFWNLQSYDNTHNWWDKLWDYGFGGLDFDTNDEFKNVAPIQMISPEDMSVSDLATHLKINPDDVSTFKNYYNAIKKDSELFVFRYAQTDYWAEDLNILEISSNKNHMDVGQIRQGTQIFDFDIIEFTFNKEGEYTVISVVSSPVDHYSDYTPTNKPESDNWLEKLLKIIALAIFIILVFVILAPLLPYILNGIVFIISLPFKLIGSIFKAIKKTSKKE